MRFLKCLSTEDSLTDTAKPASPGTSGSSTQAQSIPQDHTRAETDAAHKVKPGCVFCDVSKEKGFKVIYEDEELIAFHDRKPRATVHLLIIPRYHVDSVKSLSGANLPMLDRMIALADSLLLSLDPPPGPSPKLGFHIPPFSSVPHLHLHVLVPPYTFFGQLKYPISKRNSHSDQLERDESGKVKGWSWFVEVHQVKEILQRGRTVKIGSS